MPDTEDSTLLNIVLVVISLLFAIATLCLSMTGCFYLVVVPHTKPSYPDFEIDSISVSDWFYDPNRISASWSIDINVKNFNVRPNMTYYFSNVDVSILYDKRRLWLTSVKDFNVGPKNVNARVGVKLWGSSGFVEDTMFNAILADMNSNRSVKFDVKFEGAVKNWWFSWARSFVVDCKDVELSYFSEGKMVSGLKGCQIKFNKSPKVI